MYGCKVGLLICLQAKLQAAQPPSPAPRSKGSMLQKVRDGLLAANRYPRLKKWKRS